MEEEGTRRQQISVEEIRNNMQKQREELMDLMENLTSKENWDRFFTMTGSVFATEWYAEWDELESLLIEQLVFLSPAETEGSEAPAGIVEAADVRILVPGCGNSSLSENLYDAGYWNIINVDYSKVVIADMLRKNVRERPMMKWRVMDMTNLQFENQTFDVVVDKGGLDTLVKAQLGTRLGKIYLTQVKRLLKNGGRYICITLAESRVLDLLFPTFRFWWKTSVYPVAPGPSSRNQKLQTFMVVAEKDTSCVVSEISSLMHEDSVDPHSDQVRKLCEALEREMKVRLAYWNDSDILHSLDDLKLGVEGSLTELEPGRRVKLTLGEPGVTRFFYNAVILDAQRDSGPCNFHCATILVPKLRVHDWLFSSIEGQWLLVENSQAARLVLILLDSSNFNNAKQVIQRDLSPLLDRLCPGNREDGRPVRFTTAGGGTTQKKIVHQVTSAVTGPIVVEDVMYTKVYHAISHNSPSKDSIFRHLTFQRPESVLQSEALLSTEGPIEISSEAEKNEMHTDSKTRKKGKQKKIDSATALSPVNHNYLASPYHNGIISGLMLKGFISAEGMIKTVIIGLGAGVLPMFMRNCLPSLEIEVVELDPVVSHVARDYFGFKEDECLKVRLGDGVRFVKKKAEDSESGKDSSKIDILIVDVDSTSPSYALTCPEMDFIEESFLFAVKCTLSEQGVFIMNLVSRSSYVKTSVYSRMKTVFSNVFTLALEERVSEVIFAVKSQYPIKEDQLSKACGALARSLEQENPDWGQRIIDASKKIKPLA